MERLAVLLVAIAVCASAVPAASPATGRPGELSRRCARGSVAATISGRQVCLRAGQPCVTRLDMQYQRYGFRCPFTGRLERIPPAAGRVIATIDNSVPGYVAAGDGAIWVRGQFSAQVLRVDPERNAVVGRISLPQPVSSAPYSLLSGIAAGGGGVWVTLASRDEVVRIDAATGAIVATIPVAGAPAGIALTPGSAWVACRFGRSVARIDTSTNRVVATIAVGTEAVEGPTAVAAGAGAVWVVASSLHGVARINPVTNAIDSVIPLPLARNGWTGIAADAAFGVWVAGADLAQIDPLTNEVVATIAGYTSPVAVAIGLGSIWDLRFAANRLSRIHPGTHTVVGESEVGLAAPSLTVAFGSVWVASGDKLLRIRPT